jgi:hypothetical protein
MLWAKSSSKNPVEEKALGSRQKWKGRKIKPNGPSADVSTLVDAIKAEGRANRREEQREDSAKRWREWITIVLLGATVVAVGMQVHEMIKVYGPVKQQADAASTQSENSNKALIESQRAWVGPNGAKLSSAVVANSDVVIETGAQNTGREPALNFTYYITPIFATAQEDSNGTLSAKIADFVKTCKATRPKPAAQVLYPSVGFGTGFSFATTVDKSRITKGFVAGSEYLIVPGCLIYDTFNTTRHSTFCYFFKNGSTKIESLNLCTNGSTAD